MHRRRSKHCLEPLLFSSLAFLLVFTQRASAEQSSTQPKTFYSTFVVRLVSVQNNQHSAVITHLHDCYMPVWRKLYSEEIITSINVFTLSSTDSTTIHSPPWHYLLLAELGVRATPDDLLNAEKTSMCRKNDDTLFSVLRLEKMSCTPGSCIAMPKSTYPDASSGIDYLIEFIGVEDSLSSRTKYRSLMTEYFGPANGVLVEGGLLHCFVALETTETFYESPGILKWNQIHVSDHWDVGGDVDWDAVYTDIFRQKFSCKLDSVWAELPPNDNSVDYRGRLIPDLCLR